MPRKPPNKQQVNRSTASMVDLDSTSSSNANNEVFFQHAQVVKNLIELCLQLYMNKKEVVEHLFNNARIEPDLITLIWQRMEEDNPKFFKAYYTRLELIKQIKQFNLLLQNQFDHMKWASLQNDDNHMFANETVNCTLPDPRLDQLVDDFIDETAFGSLQNDSSSSIPTSEFDDLCESLEQDNTDFGDYFSSPLSTFELDDLLHSSNHNEKDCFSTSLADFGAPENYFSSPLSTFEFDGLLHTSDCNEKDPTLNFVVDAPTPSPNLMEQDFNNQNDFGFLGNDFDSPMLSDPEFNGFFHSVEDNHKATELSVDPTSEFLGVAPTPDFNQMSKGFN